MLVNSDMNIFILLYITYLKTNQYNFINERYNQC